MRGVRHEAEADAALRIALERWERADEVWDAALWNIAREPTVGVPVTESGRVRSLTIQGARSIGWPTLTVLYEFDDQMVIVHGALIKEAGAYKPGCA